MMIKTKKLALTILLPLFVLTACTSVRSTEDLSLPTSTPIPDIIVTAVPTVTPVPRAEPGTTRENPSPLGSSFQQGNLKFRVEQMLRGEEAWRMVQDANPYNEPPAPGQEYLLLNMHVENIGEEDEISDVETYRFSVTGDALQVYSSPGVVAPEPKLTGGLFPGGALNGWLVFSIAEGEHNLLFIASGSYLSDTPTQYIALEENASVSADPLLSTLSVTENGLKRTSPADIGELLRTEDWEVTVNTVLRGDKAWEKLLEANQFNDPPLDGMEYMLVNITVRYIGTAEPRNVGGISFYTTGSKNVIYDLPSAVEPEPQLASSLFPGGMTTGWLALQIGKDEERRLLIFDPEFGKDRRFIKLSE